MGQHIKFLIVHNCCRSFLFWQTPVLVELSRLYAVHTKTKKPSDANFYKSGLILTVIISVQLLQSVPSL